MCSDSFFLFFFDSHHKISLYFNVYCISMQQAYSAWNAMNAFLPYIGIGQRASSYVVMLTTIRFYWKWNVYGARINSRLMQPENAFLAFVSSVQNLRIQNIIKWYRKHAFQESVFGFVFLLFFLFHWTKIKDSFGGCDVCKKENLINRENAKDVYDKRAKINEK